MNEQETLSLPLARVVSARRVVGNAMRRVAHDKVSVAQADANSVLGEPRRFHRLESDDESKHIQTPSLRRFRQRRRWSCRCSPRHTCQLGSICYRSRRLRSIPSYCSPVALPSHSYIEETGCKLQDVKVVVIEVDGNIHLLLVVLQIEDHQSTVGRETLRRQRFETIRCRWTRSSCWPFLR